MKTWLQAPRWKNLANPSRFGVRITLRGQHLGGELSAKAMKWMETDLRRSLLLQALRKKIADHRVSLKNLLTSTHSSSLTNHRLRTLQLIQSYGVKKKPTSRSGRAWKR